MRSETGTSALSAFLVGLMVAKKSPLHELEIEFSLFILRPPVAYFQKTFCAFGPQLNYVCSNFVIIIPSLAA